MNTLKAILVLVIVVSFSSCGIDGSSEGDEKLIDSLSTVLASKESDIQNNLKLLDNIDAALKEANPNGNIEVNDPEKVKAIDQEIFNKIKVLRDKLESDNNEIEKLRSDLAKAKESASYRKELIDKVSARMEAYEKENALLKQQISRETQDISNLTAELEAQGLKISKLQQSLKELNADIIILKAEINTAFYIVGTKKELKNDLIISKKGMGGAITLNENLDHSKFKQINKEVDQTISFTGFKKVVLVPERPEKSYKLITRDKLVVQLQIVDPDQFWEVSKYLVLVVK